MQDKTPPLVALDVGDFGHQAEAGISELGASALEGGDLRWPQPATA